MKAIDNLENCCQIERSEKEKDQGGGKGQTSDENSKTYSKEGKCSVTVSIEIPWVCMIQKVMIGIMRAIVVDAIEVEWMTRPQDVLKVLSKMVKINLIMRIMLEWITFWCGGGKAKCQH